MSVLNSDSKSKIKLCTTISVGHYFRSGKKYSDTKRDPGIFRDGSDPKEREGNVQLRLPEMRLDLDFSPQLVLNTGLLQLFLEEHLQGQDKLGLPLSSQINIAKFTLSQGSANIKVLQAPTRSEWAQSQQVIVNSR